MANIELDGPNKKIKVDSGDLTLDVPGDIILDADGADLTFADGGTNILKITNSSSDVVFQNQVDAKDIIFKQYDGTEVAKIDDDGSFKVANSTLGISQSSSDVIIKPLTDAKDIIFQQYDGTAVATVEDNGTLNIPTSKLAINGTAITSTAAELNILDGVTATATELNLIDGVTATTAELNILDGVTSTAAELNILDGVTSTAAELNIVDGNTSATATTIADADRVVLNDNGTMVQAAVTDLKTYIGGGDWTQVASGGASAGDGTLTVAGCFTSSYKVYKIFLYDWNGSAGNAPYLRWLTGTNTEQSGSNEYFYSGVGFNTSGQNSAWSGNDNQFQIAGESFEADATDHFGFEGTLYNPAGTVMHKRFVMSGGGKRSGPYEFSAHGAGVWHATTAITGFKVWPSGGNFDSCEYEVYGLKS